MLRTAKHPRDAAYNALGDRDKSDAELREERKRYKKMLQTKLKQRIFYFVLPVFAVCTVIFYYEALPKMVLALICMATAATLPFINMEDCCV